MNQIQIKDWTATDETIIDGQVLIEDALAAEELRIDTLTATLDGGADIPTIFQPSDADGMLTSEEQLYGVRPWHRELVQDFSGFQYGDPVRFTHDGDLIGGFFFEAVSRESRSFYRISATSVVGLLVNSQHYGGLYTGEPLEDVLEDIIGGVAPYTLDERLEGIPVYGWLPVATRRDNLHQLLFAEGAIASKDVAGGLHITVLEEADTPADLDDGRLLSGGSVEYRTPATQALISEHAYASYDSDETVTLFEGEVAAEPLTSPQGQAVTGALVVFDGPMHDLTVENGAILEQGVNYAVLGQSSNCLLTGKSYTHTVRVLSTAPVAQGLALAEQSDNTVTVEDATLVSPVNSENVAARIAAYYGATKTVSVGITVGDERPGDTVSFSDPFDEGTVGFLSSLDINISGTLTAEAKLLAGYVPGDYGNYYTHSAIITAEQDWTVPAGAKDKIRAVLIGGGDGGEPGSDGEAGGNGDFNGNEGPGGAGGAGGKGGKGGKIFVVTMAATEGQTFHAVPGIGGDPGEPGAASTFGEHSSEDGSSSDDGYVDILTGSTYARPGASGISGGKGAGTDGTGENVEYKGVTCVPGERGADYSTGSFSGTGGYGGGPAAGADGLDGEAPEYDTNQGHGSMDGGHGGKGANAVQADTPTVPGSGGNGGHGGGGGGGAGAVSGPEQYIWFGYGGDGGLGGLGSKGANGIIIVYW